MALAHPARSVPPPQAGPFEARLEKARMLSPNVREFVFRRADDAPLAFLPGQWVTLHFEGDLKRAYSIASPPEGTPEFEIAVTRVIGGPASEALHAMSVGSTVHAVGPSGLFYRHPTDATPSLFVGTGTGVTPLRSMMKAALAAGSKAPLWLLFGVRQEEDILYRDEIERWCREHENVRAFVTLSRPAAGWAGRDGYVQAHLPELWRDLAAPRAQIYVCGLEKMVKSVRDLLRKDMGIDRKQIQQERYD